MIPAILLAVANVALAPPRVVSLAYALSRSDQAAEVLVARAVADVERRRVDAARAGASPVVSLGTTRYSARESVALSQEIRWGGERRFAVLAAGETAGSAAANAALASLDARRLVREAWVALAAAEDQEELGRESSRRAGEILAIVRARVEGGRAPRLDLIRGEAEAARVAALATALAESRRAAWSHLAALLGFDPASDGRTDGERPAPLDEASLTRVLARALAAQHPALVSSERSLAAAAAALEASRRRLLPGLTLSVGVNADDPGLPGPDQQATLSLTLPIGARGRTAVAIARAEVCVLEARREAVRRELAEARAVSERRFRGVRAGLEALSRQAVPAAEESARLTREAYAEGRGDVFRVVDAERALLEVRAARLTAWADVKAAEAELLATAGEEGE